MPLSPDHTSPPETAPAMPSAVRPLPSRRLLARTVLGLLASALAIAVIAQYTDIDLALADFYYNTAEHDFPWNHSWFARNFMHGYLKNVIVWLGFLFIGTMLFDLVVPLRRLSPLRRLQLRFLALAATLEPLLVRSLKERSNLHCPIAIDRYGGSEPLLRLLDAVPAGWHPGHCFPAGHASAGMWLSALAILWLPSQPRQALAVFAGGLSVGLVMGWVQQMRGMHFLTHTLATAWVSTTLLLAMLLLCWQPLQAAVAARNQAPRGLTARLFARSRP